MLRMSTELIPEKMSNQKKGYFQDVYFLCFQNKKKFQYDNIYLKILIYESMR